MFMKNKIVIGLISCFTIFSLMSGSLAGSIFQAEEPINQHHELLIITPSLFEESLQPLVDHKENIGMSAHLVTLETIQQHRSTTQGRDDAEKMKYYIKYAVE